jgi:hypothetical protein
MPVSLTTVQVVEPGATATELASQASKVHNSVGKK